MIYLLKNPNDLDEYIAELIQQRALVLKIVTYIWQKRIWVKDITKLSWEEIVFAVLKFLKWLD